jgi:NAD(P)-dependent dehydrogenase (short-subunit alcohol dehydrogenase family)
MGQELAGKIALIAGAGSGIGRGAAVALAQEGALIAVH